MQSLLYRIIKGLGIEGDATVVVTPGQFTDLLEVTITDNRQWGKVIGKSGRTISAIRGLFSSLAARNHRKAMISTSNILTEESKPRHRTYTEPPRPRREDLPRTCEEYKHLLNDLCRALTGSTGIVIETDFHQGHPDVYFRIGAPKKDIGRIIGREGNTISALRVIFSSMLAKEGISSDMEAWCPEDVMTEPPAQQVPSESNVQMPTPPPVRVIKEGEQPPKLKAQ